MLYRENLRQRGLISTGHHIPYNPRLKERARELRKHMTKAERKLWNDFLRSLSLTVLRQKPLDNYIVDFYCAKVKLVIEIDGGVHDSAEAIEHDEIKDATLEGYGLTVLRFRNEEVLQNFERVCKTIKNVIDDKSTCSHPL